MHLNLFIFQNIFHYESIKFISTDNTSGRVRKQREHDVKV